MDAENTFDKIQHPLIIKTLSDVGTEGKFPNPTGLTAGTTLVVKDKGLHPNTGHNTRLSSFPLHVIGQVPASASRQETEKRASDRDSITKPTNGTQEFSEVIEYNVLYENQSYYVH